jgi:hypothetical protein
MGHHVIDAGQHGAEAPRVSVISMIDNPGHLFFFGYFTRPGYRDEKYQTQDQGICLGNDSMWFFHDSSPRKRCQITVNLIPCQLATIQEAAAG